MIYFINKDILTNTDGIICHQVNCFKIGSGLAKDIITKFQEVEIEFNKLINSGLYEKEQLLGEVLFVPIADTGITIANIFGQYNYGRPNKNEVFTIYNALKHGLSIVYREAVYRNLAVHIPYNIGCGLGGGNWNIVLDIINSIFSETDINCYINIKE